MRKPLSLFLHGLIFGVMALLVSPFVYYLLGALLYGHRSSWAEGMGSGFVAFCAAVMATPIAALLWGGAGIWIGALRRRSDAPRQRLVLVFATSLCLWCIVGVAAQVAADFSV
jgi:hypothetical protein